MAELIETMPGANTEPPVLLLQGTGGLIKKCWLLAGD
ncbi:hypothetical protein S101174_02108 [Levilactobacillus brevis]|nr:hypothetical protein S101174_02108 [Levilactobacillus brevis]